MIMSLTTVGVECRPISPFSRSSWTCLPSLPIITPTLRSTTPPVPKPAIGLAGLGVQRHELIAGGHVDDAVVALAVGPVGQAAAGELTRRPARGALAFVHAVDPLLLAGSGVERDHGAPGAGRRVDHPLDHHRRAFELGLGARAEVVGLEPPRDFHLAEVGGVDLIERRVLAAAQIGGVHRPLAVLGAGHAAALSEHVRADPRESDGEQRDRGHDTKCDALHSFLLLTETGMERPSPW